jgi:dethiobiotin synthetase
MRGLFVTGTDTGVGKSVLSAALIAAMVEVGERVRAFKPVVTGLDEPPVASDGVLWPPDHELLASVARMSPDAVSPWRYGAAASPHLAARLEGERIDPAQLLAHARRGGDPEGSEADEEALIVEGVGGLMVPLTDDYTVRDLAIAFALPVVIAARPGLGTINHTLLTLQAARNVGLRVSAVVLTPWPEQPTALELSNRETIELMGKVDVRALAHAAPTVEDLARAGASLPWQDWMP